MPHNGFTVKSRFLKCGGQKNVTRFYDSFLSALGFFSKHLVLIVKSSKILVIFMFPFRRFLVDSSRLLSNSSAAAWNQSCRWLERRLEFGNVHVCTKFVFYCCKKCYQIDILFEFVSFVQII